MSGVSRLEPDRRQGVGLAGGIGNLCRAVEPRASRRGESTAGCVGARARLTMRMGDTLTMRWAQVPLLCSYATAVVLGVVCKSPRFGNVGCRAIIVGSTPRYQGGAWHGTETQHTPTSLRRAWLAECGAVGARCVLGLVGGCLAHDSPADASCGSCDSAQFVQRENARGRVPL